MTGTIKVLKDHFGFISVDGEDDAFFHANNLEGVSFEELQEGQTLSFEMAEGRNGKLQAVNVTLVD